MSRQINSDIFNDPSFVPASSSAGFEPIPLVESPVPDARYEELAGLLDKTRYQLKEWAQSVNLRLERIALKFQAVEERMKQASLENHQRLNHLASKIRGGGSSEMKVESLIERHNQIVQNFELRLSQAQRLIENQSLQLSKQQELIDDARRQIEKLKKL